MYLLMRQLLQPRSLRGSNTAKRPFSSVPAQFILLPMMLMGVYLSEVAAADILSELESGQQLRITRICASVQFDEGASAYRQCILDQIATAVSNQRPEAAALSALSLDEQFTIQQICDSGVPYSPATNTRCTLQQIAELEQEPSPELSALTEDEQYIITTQCFTTDEATTARDYRVCVNRAASSLDTLPAADFSEESVSTRRNVQLECSIYSATVSRYRMCLLSALGIAFTDTSIRNTPSTPGANIIERAESIDTDQQKTIEAGQSRQAVEMQEPLTATGDPPLTQVDENNRVTQDSPASLSTTASASAVPSESDAYASLLLKLLLVASALSIPLILLGIRLAPQSDKARPYTATAQSATAQRVQPEEDARFYKEPSPAPPDLRPSSSANADNQSAVQENLSPDTQTENSVTLKNHLDNGRFASWLAQWPLRRQQEHAIELLIYWMAYADKRYDAAMKKRTFLMEDPDAHSLIKRWVFKNDATAFADAVKHLQVNTDLEQRKQVIDLLMALLVNEKALTPNQNTLLRFLADAFGIGRAGIDMQFLQAFGQLMPAVPRPDKTTWWQSLDSDQNLRWDVHAIARQSEQIRCRIVLGQPLSGALDQQSIDRSYAMAMNRCHDKRASRLGERERMLLLTQRQKFVSAHNTLLEPVE